MKFPVTIKSVLRFNKDHYSATIYKFDRYRLNLQIGDIAIILVNGTQLVRPIHVDYNIKLPTKLYGKKHNRHRQITFKILKIVKPSACRSRPIRDMSKNTIDIRSIIPTETKFGKPIYIIPWTSTKSIMWYPHGGGIQHISILNKYDSMSLGELLGFYYGDGTTCASIRSFRLTNCEPSTLFFCLNLLTKLGVPRKWFKVQVIYSTPTRLDLTIERRCKRYWSSQLNLPLESLVSVTKSTNKNESLRHGSARLCVDNSLLVEIFLHGFLKNVLTAIKKSKLSVSFLIGFLRGLLAAEGLVQLNKHKSVIRCGIAFDPYSEEVIVYKRLLQLLGIEWKNIHGNELLISRWPNMKKLSKINAFKLHNSRQRKFLVGMKNHRYN